MTIEPEPDAEVTYYAREWARDAGLSGDKWLERAVCDVLAGEGPLAETMAVGLLWRLWLFPEGTTHARAEVAALLAHKPTAHEEREWLWAASLSEGQRMLIDLHALGAAERCDADMRVLEAAPRPDDDTWRAAVLALLHERDALEGVRLLLLEGAPGEAPGGCPRLRAALRALDARGEVFVAAIPHFDGVSADEHLRRAARVSPEGWWTAPVGWA